LFLSECDIKQSNMISNLHNSISRRRVYGGSYAVPCGAMSIQLKLCALGPLYAASAQAMRLQLKLYALDPLYAASAQAMRVRPA